MTATAVRSAVLAALLLLSATAPVVGAVPGADGTDERGATSASTADALSNATQPAEGVVRHELHRAGPGRVRVDLAVGVVDGTTEFEVTLPANATVVGTEGFSRSGDGGDTGPTYAWDGSTERPSVSYRAPVNRTAGGSLRFGSTADWALVDVTDLDAAYRWRSFGDTSYERAFRAPEGRVGSAMAFLGPHRTATRTAAGTRFAVVVPAAASANASAGAFADTLASLSERLDVGGRDEQVTAFVAPAPVGTDGGGEGGLGGLATDADLWVAAATATEPGPDGPRVRTAIWTHEYLHTRQNYSLAAQMGWFTEASAYHYMSVVPRQRGELGGEAFRRQYRVAEERRGAVLRGSQRYDVWSETGARTLAALDRRIRAATDGSRTLGDLLRRMNDHEGDLTEREFRELVAATAGESQDAWLDDHVVGSALAPPPDPDAYPEAAVPLAPDAVEYDRGGEWTPVPDGPLPAGVPVRVRHPTAGVVVRPGTATAVNVSGGDPATVELPAGESTLRVETFYGDRATTLTVTASEDVDGDGVTNAVERDRGSDPFDADSTPTPTPGSGSATTGGPATTDGTDPGATTGNGPGFGPVVALVAAALLLLAAARPGRERPSHVRGGDDGPEP